MQKFGIEIRKVGSTAGLYNEVDNILGKAGITRGSIGNLIKIKAVAHALQEMLKTENHFSICTIDRCIEITQICIPKERYQIYHSIHCMNWNEMLQDFRQMIVAMILDDFRTVLNPEID